MATLDIKDAYFLVPIIKGDIIYLRFKWDSNLYHNQLFEFNLNLLPLVFIWHRM